MRGRAACGAALALLLAVGTALAAIPASERVSDELARANRASRRAEPLIFDVALRIGEGAPAATGVLATHPTGLARLELTSERGFVERHLLQGNEYSASRDGEPLAAPRPFLPPLFLLQASNGASLRAALASFGVATQAVNLGLADDRDCYVIGGRIPGAPPRPSLWVSMDDFQVVQVDRGDGVRFRFGPAQVYGGIQAPAWISIEVPGQSPARLEVKGVTRANAPAAAFSAEWLSGGTTP